jgi:peptidoglycan/LPS O-acetylase OafA/YrhL
VFFVVSGFLITTLLVSERDITGRVSLVDFYARRVRRLLPLAALVLASTLAAGWVLLDQVTAAKLGTDATWASLFGANIHFGSVGTEYLTATEAPSALQHFWSLAIEEQFYLLWPALLVLVWRTGFNRVKAAGWLAAGVTAASFAFCMWLSDTQPVWAFFALPARAWELAAGAVLAVTLRYVRISIRVAAPWVGLAGLAATFVLLPKTASFPGPLALIPVAATLGVLCAVNTGTRVSRALSHPVLQWLGSRSYALYLWHWPLLVFAEYQFGALDVVQRLAALAVTFVLAELSHRLVEAPIRSARALVDRSRLSITFGLVLAASTALGGVALTANASGLSAPAPPAASSPALTPTTEAPAIFASDLAGYVAGSRRLQLQSDLARSQVPQSVTPSLARASKDVPVPFINGCLAPLNATDNPACFAGHPNLPVEVVFFGDSKAAQWFPGMQVVGERANWRVSVISKASCPAANLPVKTPSGTMYSSCAKWRTKAIARIAQSKATVVVISSNWYVDASGLGQSWSDSLTETVVALRQAGKRVVIFSNTPVWPQAPATCAARNSTNLQTCSLPLSKVTSFDRNRAEAAVAKATGAMFIDVSRWLCTDRCPVISGSTLMYMDSNHISATMSRELDKPLELAIRAALETTP